MILRGGGFSECESYYSGKANKISAAKNEPLADRFHSSLGPVHFGDDPDILLEADVPLDPILIRRGSNAVHSHSSDAPVSSGGLLLGGSLLAGAGLAAALGPAGAIVGAVIVGAGFLGAVNAG